MSMAGRVRAAWPTPASPYGANQLARL